MSKDYAVEGEKYLEQVEFDSTNPEPRCPCVLLLDTSGSMIGDPIDELNKGLKEFEASLKKDDLAAMRVEIAIVSFGGEVKIMQDFITADQFNAPALVPNGQTPMGEAILLSLDMLKDRKKVYKDNSISYFRPWIWLITDGAPTDDWQTAAKEISLAENNGSVAFFPVGVQGADMDTLQNISIRKPKALKGLEFKDMFLWLSSSLNSVSHSKPGEQVPLKDSDGWSFA